MPEMMGVGVLPWRTVDFWNLKRNFLKVTALTKNYGVTSVTGYKLIPRWKNP